MSALSQSALTSGRPLPVPTSSWLHPIAHCSSSQDVATPTSSLWRHHWPVTNKSRDVTNRKWAATMSSQSAFVPRRMSRQDSNDSNEDSPQRFGNKVVVALSKSLLAKKLKAWWDLGVKVQHREHQIVFICKPNKWQTKVDNEKAKLLILQEIWWQFLFWKSRTFWNLAKLWNSRNF